ncbi:RbsD/FucU domain-containing protein, partial [Acinetobacter baumannii]
MLKSIDPILTPDLLWLLASMGHGDDLVFVDANHPAARIAQATASQRLIRLPGMAMEVAA